MSEIKRFYAFYDKVSKLFDNVFPSVNDLTAQRFGQEQCNSLLQKKSILVKDLEIYFLFSIDISTGKIVDNNPNLVFSLNDYAEQLKEMEAVKNV